MRKALGTIALAALTLASCGSPTSELSASALLAQAPDRVTDAGSAKMEMKGTVTVGFGGQNVETVFESQGVIEFASGLGRTTFQVSSDQFDDIGVELSRCEIVNDGQTAYLSIPEGERERFDGKPWAKSTIEVGVSADDFSRDPTAALDYLRAVGEDVTEVGSEEVRGVATTHYRADVATETIIEQIPEDQRENAREGFGSLGVSTLPIEAWIDGEGLLRKMRFVMKPGGDESQLDFQSEIVIEYYDFGEPVDIEVPSDDQAFETDDMAEAASVCQGIPAASIPGG